VILRPTKRKIRVKQIVLDKCNEEPYTELKKNSKYVDELIVLPDESVIVVEHAEWPTAHEGAQALASFRKLVEMGIKVAAIVVVGKRGFDKRDKGLIAQALRSVSSKHNIPVILKRTGQTLSVKSIKFTIVN